MTNEERLAKTIELVSTSLTGRWRYTLSRNGETVATDVCEHELEQHIV